MKIKLNKETTLSNMAKYAKSIKAKLVSWQGRLYLHTSSGHIMEIEVYE